MDLNKKYTTSYGVECNILQMVKIEPEWAANMIQAGEKAIRALKEIQKYNSIHNDLESYLFEVGEYGLGQSSSFPNCEDYGISTNEGG